MKRIYTAALLILMSVVAYGQNGIQNIELETYYVANAADQTALGVPAGSKTYRIWVELAPGWRLNSIFAAPELGTGAPLHNLKVETTTSFFNANGVFGTAFTPTYMSAAYGLDKAYMIDSWFSVGRAASDKAAVMKALDGDGSLAGAGPALQNNDPLAGTPLTTADGIVGFGAFAPPQADVLGTEDQTAFTTGGSSIDWEDGAIYNLSGILPNSDNRICIAQITTDGSLSYELNLQVQNTTTGVAQNWVAANQQAGEFTAPFMSYYPNVAPSIVITAPSAGATYLVGDVVTIEADATDTDGSVDSVAFYADGNFIGFDITPAGNTFSFSWTSTAGAVLTARAFDNDGDSTTSASVTINVGANQAPVTFVTAPSNGASFKVGATVNITATATDATGLVDSVRFYVDGAYIGTDLTAPYQASWTAAGVGPHNISATAWDNFGLSGNSNTVGITVVANQLPVVTLTSPANNYTALEGTVVTLSATASDNDGTVDSVEFLVDGVVVNTDLTDPYTYDWTSVAGIQVVTAKAYDNDGGVSTSTSATIDIAALGAQPYKVTTVKQECTENSFCLPINKTVASSIADVIGFDFRINFDNTKVNPTGVVEISNDMIDFASYASYTTNIFTDYILVSIYFNGTAPQGHTWKGNGDVCCVNFSTLPAFSPVDTADFSIPFFQESYVGQVLPALVQDGQYISYKDSTFTGSLKLWNGYMPLAYNPSTSTYKITNIFGSLDSNDMVQPDTNGNFEYSINNGPSINILRDVANAEDVMAVINGLDQLLTKKVLVDDITFVPNVFQLIAMDVNTDGVVSAGDLSQISQRTVLSLGEFRQDWNYNNQLTSDGRPSYDWLFVENKYLDSAAYIISASYPNDDALGYSKYSVPNVPQFHILPITDISTCPVIDGSIYQGVMLGDVDGNVANYINSANLYKSSANNKVIVDFTKAVVANGYLEVPVSVFTDAQAIDFAITLNNNYAFESLTNVMSGVQVRANFNNDDATLRVSSFSLNSIPAGQSVMTLRFSVVDPMVSSVSAVAAFTDGEPADLTLIETITGINEVNEVMVEVYPNPAKEMLFINVNEDVMVTMVDITGRIVMSDIQLLAGRTNEISTNDLSNGVYFINFISENDMITKRIIIKK